MRNPGLVVYYLRYSACRYVNQPGDNGVWDTVFFSLSNCYNLITIQLAKAVGFTKSCAKSSVPRMFDIRRGGHPLKVASSVVGLYPVDVVDLKPVCVSVNPRESDKSVDVVSRPVLFAQRCNPKIPRWGNHNRGYFSGFISSRPNLTPSVNRFFIDKSFSQYATVCGHLQVWYARNITPFISHFAPMSSTLRFSVHAIIPSCKRSFYP